MIKIISVFVVFRRHHIYLTFQTSVRKDHSQWNTLIIPHISLQFVSDTGTTTIIDALETLESPIFVMSILEFTMTSGFNWAIKGSFIFDSIRGV